jgi:two-component system, NtrC family, response regulator AtoC
MDDKHLDILVIDDEPNIRSGLAKGLRGEAHLVEVAEDGEQGWAKFQQGKYEIVITDLRLPGEIDGLEVVQRIHDQHPETHVIVITAHGTVETAVEAMRRGAYDFVTKPVDLNVIRHQVRKAAEHHRLRDENRRLREHLADAGEIPEIIGNCAATQDVLRQVRQVANTDATVLIFGESGTGKELAARAIHRLSDRRAKPFVTLNLGALPDSLLESELFGYEKGAFTDARRQKIGRFEAAQGGTIFLDEITETSAKSQVDLLRVLEERELRRLGGDEVIPVDVRIVSATNKDIEALVERGEFREDLFYRLNVVPVRVPPLRDRREDIPLLVDSFLAQFCTRHRREPKRASAEAMRAMIAWNWPGNIRQLRNFVERLVVTTNSDVIHFDDLPTETREAKSDTVGTLSAATERAEKEAILAALAANDYHRERTATMLDISVRSLHYKMNRYGLH